MNFKNKIILGDSIGGLSVIPNNSIHLILSDIPYGISHADWDVLHTNTNSALLGSSPAQRTAGAVFKSRGKPINGWSEADKRIPLEYQTWCSTWASEWKRVLKPGGSAMIFAGRRFSHRCTCAMEDAGFGLKDSLAWLRQQAPHRAQRLSVVFERRKDFQSAENWAGWRVGNLRPIYEPILWFVKPYKLGSTIADNAKEHGVGAFNEAGFLRYNDQPNNVIHAGMTKSERRLHPAQKPLSLMQALVELTTKKDQIVLDPFAGSGTTLLAAKNLGRNYLGYEISEEYHRIATDRLEDGLL